MHFYIIFYIFLYESMIPDLKTPVFRTERIVYLPISILYVYVCMKTLLCIVCKIFHFYSVLVFV